MTTLIIVRHGNTFDPGDTPLRVGLKTDLPLSLSGQQQALALGDYFLEKKIFPDRVYCSELLRTQQTAKLILSTLNRPELSPQPKSIFNEIDYGPDEGKTEPEVIARIGKTALENWDKAAVVPSGWNFDPQATIAAWQAFSNTLLAQHKGQTLLVVTSNGIARFAPYLTGHFDTFAAKNSIKLKTGAFARLYHDDAHWQIKAWNLRPDSRVAATL